MPYNVNTYLFCWWPNLFTSSITIIICGNGRKISREKEELIPLMPTTINNNMYSIANVTAAYIHVSNLMLSIIIVTSFWREEKKNTNIRCRDDCWYFYFTVVNGRHTCGNQYEYYVYTYTHCIQHTDIQQEDCGSCLITIYKWIELVGNQFRAPVNPPMSKERNSICPGHMIADSTSNKPPAVIMSS